MDAFERLRRDLDDRPCWSGIVFLSQQDAREILDEHHRLVELNRRLADLAGAERAALPAR